MGADRPPIEPSERLADLIARTDFDDLPPSVVSHAKKSILDTLAVTIAGSAQEGIPAVVEMVEGWGGIEESTVLVYGKRVPAPSAAFANGPMARALDMGDVHEEGGHVGEYILPALLAAAELLETRGQPVGGREFIAAYVLGAEVLARVGLACSAISNAGLRNPQMGSFGASAGVAKLLGFDRERIWNALGIAHVTASGFDSQMYFEGSLMCRVHHAHVCRDALLAALLTERGITGVKEIFTGKSNFFSLHYPHSSDPRRLTEGLGTTWEFAEGTMIKPYMCCKLFHTPIYAVRSLVEEHRIDAAAIERIELRVSGQNWQPLLLEADYDPRSFIECQFSAPWTIAVGAIDGRIFLDAYEDLFRPDVRTLMGKVEIVPDDELPNWAAVARVRAGGVDYEKRVDYCLGHPKNPVDWHWLDAKLTRCADHAARPLPEVKRLLEVVRDLELLENAAEIVALVTA